MAAALLALLSSACWGTADFAAGLLSRRLHVLSVALVSQAAGLAALLALVAGGGAALPHGDALALSVAAGLAGGCGLIALYRALAVGVMTVVAPLSATAVAVPVAFGLATGDRPSALQLAGMAAAAAGVVAASRPPEHEREPAALRESAVLALVAAACLGGFTVLMGRAASNDAAAPGLLLAARVASTVAVGGAWLATRPALPRGRRSIAAVAAVGLLDTGANALFVLASTRGYLALVGLLAELYPVATILLARTVLGERVAGLQRAGVVAVLAGVLMIAAG